MSPFDVFASCAPGVAECNDTGSPFLAGDNTWTGLVVIALVVAIIFVTVRLRGRRRQ